MTEEDLSAAVAVAMLRGRRTGVLYSQKGSVDSDKHGMQDVNEFWNAAKSPPPLQPADVNHQQTAKQQTIKPRYSLPNAKDGDANASRQSKELTAFRSNLSQPGKNGRRVMSPSELSRVSTAPPSPQEQEPEFPAGGDDDGDFGANDDDTVPLSPEEARSSPEETLEETHKLSQEQEQHPSPAPTSPMGGGNNDFPPPDELSDDDDLVPPPPPDDSEDEEVEEEAQDNAKDDNVGPTSPGVDFPNEVQDDYDEGDDDDALAGSHDLRTPESAQESLESEPVPAAKPRSKKKKKKEKAPRKTNTKESKRKGPFSSPPGYQVADRQFEIIPVSEYKASPEKGVRRSRRARFPPLEFWKNEQLVFEAHNEEGELGKAMGNMPMVTGVQKGLPTPYKKRKVTHRAGSNNNNNKSGKRPSARQEVDAVEEAVFDDRKLKRKYKYQDSETACLWDEARDAESDMKVVAYANNLVQTKLPLPKDRRRGEGKVVAEAAQAFNVPTDDQQLFMGYIMGQLVLPPKGIKDHESVGQCAQTFTVCNGQHGAIELAFADPHEDEGDFDPDTAIRYLLSPGDMFRVPPGNSYRIQNHSKTTEATLTWTIIRPRVS